MRAGGPGCTSSRSTIRPWVMASGDSQMTRMSVDSGWSPAESSAPCATSMMSSPGTSNAVFSGMTFIPAQPYPNPSSEPGSQGGNVRAANQSETLADRLRRLRAKEHLTREGLSVRTAELDPQRPVSVAMIGLMEARVKPYRLPTRMSTRGLAIETVARALNVELEELLDCFSDEDLAHSCFAHRRTAAVPQLAGGKGLAASVPSLPTRPGDRLRGPGPAPPQ